MNKVYSVANGFITEYDIIKETKCYYYISKGTYNDRLSKDGIALYPRLGGRTTETTDILKASEAAQTQINTINEYLEKQEEMMSNAKSELKVFVEIHTVIEGKLCQ
jgi:hypothetical protein